MACGGCNSVAPVTKDQVENLIQKAIDSGKVQGGLKTCAGEKLPAESKVLMCSELTDAVNVAIEKGDIKAIKDVVYKENEIVVTDGTGKDHEYELPYPTMAVGNTEVVFTQPNGTTVAVPKTGAGLTEDDFDKTIGKGANVDGKLGVKAKENGGLETSDAGVAVKTGDGVTIDENGAIALGEVFAKKPITGKGTKADPLTVALSSKDFNVNPATGEISLKANDSAKITDLDAGFHKVGYSTFYGFIGKAVGDYVKGVPADINSTEATAEATSEISQLADGQAYDFNGWQIASPVQVDQYLVGTDKAVWHRTNDAGMNADGTLKEPTNWSVWHRETNVTANVLQIAAMQKQVDDLTNRVYTLETLLGNFVNLKDASGKVLLGSIKP